MATSETTIYRYRCENCGKMFGTEQNLLRQGMGAGFHPVCSAECGRQWRRDRY